MISRKAQDIGVLFALSLIVIGAIMFVDSWRGPIGRQGYFQAVDDSAVYLKHKGRSPDYSWFIQAQAHPRKSDQSEEAWLTEIGIYQAQWEQEHYKTIAGK